jgi:archaemetzincin
MVALTGCGEGEERGTIGGPGNIPYLEKVLLQPLGKVPENHIKLVSEALISYYNFDLEVAEAIELPKMAWYAPRKRYRADSLLRYLSRRRLADADRIVGFTAVDISTSKGKHKDFGIMGLGMRPGRSCVLSTYRMRRGTTQEQFEARLLRVARHEVGHTLGLPHCENPDCLMRDAKGKASTMDQASDEMCGRCRYLIRKVLREKEG